MLFLRFRRAQKWMNSEPPPHGRVVPYVHVFPRVDSQKSENLTMNLCVKVIPYVILKGGRGGGILPYPSSALLPSLRLSTLIPPDSPS